MPEEPVQQESWHSNMSNQQTDYFFHNVYGDCSELLGRLPEGVVAVPWGPDQETEKNRNLVIQEIGQSPSSLPSLFFRAPNDAGEVQGAGQWLELRVSDIGKPFEWSKITEVKTAILEAFAANKQNLPSLTNQNGG